jgi:hypothetical protein
MTTDFSKLSIRAMSWLGAYCLRQYCLRQHVDDERIWTFCRYVEGLATTEDLPEWDGRASDLQVSGLGDPLPTDLQENEDLVRLVAYVHEINASQIYGAWQPDVAAKYLQGAAALAGSRLDELSRMHVFRAHNPGKDGWGSPIDAQTKQAWRDAAQPGR